MALAKSSVLIIDDEQSLRDFVNKNLEVRGFQTYTAANGLEGLALFNTQDVDLVIVDLMMPHMNGLETIRRIRQDSLVPIIVLSALGEENDKVQAFNIGADDFLTKPFGVRELLARINAVLRRSNWTKPQAHSGRLLRGEIAVDLDRHEVQAHGQAVDLTPTEFDLLVYLMENAGKVLPHQTILQNVWGPEYGQESEYLRVYMGRLRQKIEVNPTKPYYLRTERGIGYSFLD